MGTTWEPRSRGSSEYPRSDCSGGGARRSRSLRARARTSPCTCWETNHPPSPGRAAGCTGPPTGCPPDRDATAESFREAWERAETERVEIACGGSHGRTGTSLACLAVLDGVPAEAAVSFARHRHDHNAVETPRQQRHVTRFADQAHG